MSFKRNPVIFSNMPQMKYNKTLVSNRSFKWQVICRAGSCKAGMICDQTIVHMGSSSVDFSGQKYSINLCFFMNDG